MFRLFRSIKTSPAVKPIRLGFNQYPKTFTSNYATYKSFKNTNQFNLYSFINNRNVAYTLLGMAGFYLYFQDEAPFTHRRRFLWVPYWLEKKIGDMSYRQILYQYKANIIPYNDPIYGTISNIVDKLLQTSYQYSDNSHQINHLKKLNWQIHVIKVNSNEVPPNAFILPNGKIFIFSSILPICKDANGLATVLSHELSHQLAHHSMEQLSKQPVYITLSTVLYMATGISWFNDLLIAGLLTMPASRAMELEADRIGCELMARSCYNIHQIPDFWKRMHQYEESHLKGMRKGIFNEFLSTHPNTDKRIHDINSWMGELEQIRDASNCHNFNQFKGFF